jgi:hypothetical protein
MLLEPVGVTEPPAPILISVPVPLEVAVPRDVIVPPERLNSKLLRDCPGLTKRAAAKVLLRVS